MRKLAVPLEQSPAVLVVAVVLQFALLVHL